MRKKVKVDDEIDIRGEVCPYTFVKAKVALEQLPSGAVLKVILDHPPARENVPRSMKSEGHEIIEIENINDTDFYILIRKKK